MKQHVGRRSSGNKVTFSIIWWWSPSDRSTSKIHTSNICYRNSNRMTRPKTQEMCSLNRNAPGMMRNVNNAGNHLLQRCNNSYRHQSNLLHWNVFTSSNCNAFVSQNDSTGASVHLKRFNRDTAFVGELNPNHSSSPHWNMSRGGVSSQQTSQRSTLVSFWEHVRHSYQSEQWSASPCQARLYGHDV